jgi:hypothetical protein
MARTPQPIRFAVEFGERHLVSRKAEQALRNMERFQKHCEIKKLRKALRNVRPGDGSSRIGSDGSETFCSSGGQRVEGALVITVLQARAFRALAQE